MQIESADPDRAEGTCVALRGLTKRFDLAEAERRLLETVPLRAQEFALFLNGRRLMPRPLIGQHIPFLEGTPYGVVHGEIVLVPATQADPSQAGIACRVKQVMVKRDFLGTESWGPISSRLFGEVHADFLPLTSDRSEFIRDSAEYQAFRSVMDQVLARVRQIVAQMDDVKESRRTKRVLSDVLERVREALLRNPAFCPDGLIPLAGEAAPQGPPGYLPEPQTHASPSEAQEPSQEAPSPPNRRRSKRPQVKQLTPSAVIRRLKLGQQGLSCCIDHLGAEAPECYTEGRIVYVNRDHPLHQQFIQDREAYTLYLARLLTQEIALMKEPRSPRQSFDCQSRLLRDAFRPDDA